ncbi:pilus assembly protein TadG-related protein [Mesorhizobium sp. KR1-2]|uniref:pilus assembly protein TadG-related protein n=1 Tax=Mesorhizobium sp. KR1-2 TaxID=3156609 RepID=UPI0032B57ADA
MRSPGRQAARTLARRFLSGTSGNIAVLTALTMPVAIVLAAISVDEGALYAERREAQSLVDLAAIMAAANLDRMETAVLSTFRDNGMPDVTVLRAGRPVDTGDLPTVTIMPGRYVGSAGKAVGARFEAGAKSYNAVRVTLRKMGTRHFGNALMGFPVINAQATASVSTQAGITTSGRSALVQ